MSENKTRKPDFTNTQKGVSVWQNQKDGKTYLSIKLALLDQTIYVFENKEEKGDKTENVEVSEEKV